MAIPAGPALLTPLGGQRLVPEHALPPAQLGDWHAHVGTLAGPPNWREDPQAIQDRLRDEWR